MSKARGLADLGNVYDDGALSSRSLIINGGMVHDQRNGGSAVTAHNAYPVDRFQLKDTSSGAVSAQQLSSTYPAGFSHSLKLSCTVADTSFAAGEYVGLRYKVEGFDAAHLNWGTSSAQDITLSFYVRSNLTGVWGGVINDTSAGAAYAFTYTVNAANTFERKTITISGPTIGSWAAGNSSWCELWFASQAGSTFTASSDNQWNAEYAIAPAATVNNILSSTSNDFYITGVQLEVGDTATPFEHRSYGDELQRCQRYYQTGGVVYFRTYQVAGAYAGQGFELKSTMRATPTFAFGGNATWSNTNITGDPVVSPESNSGYIAYALWAATGDGRFQNPSGSYFTFDAEL